MDFIVLMGLLFALGLILARFKTGPSLDQIKNAPYDKHQIPTFVALLEPPSHH
jgi:hypothetical protein